MPFTTLALTAELPELGESLTWSQLEAWAVAMREELPAAALAATVEELQDRLVDDTPPQEQILVESQEAANGRKALDEALKLLNERERRIFVARRLAEEPSKLDELANKFGVSRERVRQIEVRAFEKVQSAVKGTIARQEQAALEAAL